MKKTASILLALFFLVSSSHLSFATHFCGGEAFKHALLFTTSDLECGMEDVSEAQTEECESGYNCCDTKIIELKIKDTFQATDMVVSFQPEFIFVKIASILFSVPTTENNVTLYKDYQPPLPEKDISVLFQSFLI
jgi:hypothetical protein